MAEQMKMTAIGCLPEACFRFKDTNRLKVKGWKKILHANSNQNTAGCTNRYKKLLKRLQEAEDIIY